MFKRLLFFFLVISSGVYGQQGVDVIPAMRKQLLSQKRADTALFSRYATLCIGNGQYDELISNYKILLDSAKKDMLKDDQYILKTLCDKVDTTHPSENTVYLFYITGRLFTRYHLDNTTALNYFLLSVRLAERFNDPCLIIKGYSGIGSFYMNVKHDIVIANQYFEKIDSLLLKTKMNGISECNVDVNISHAVIYYYIGNYAVGCAYLDKSIAIARKLNLPQKLFDLYIRRANFEVELGNRNKALLSLDTIEHIVSKESNREGLIQLINSYRFNIAVQNGFYDTARSLSNIVQPEKLNGTNDEYYDYLYHLAKMHIHFQEYAEAQKNIALYESSLKPWNIQRWRCVYESKYLLNKAWGKFADALDNYEKYTRLNDSVHHQQQIFAVIAEEMKFNTRQKEAQLNLQIQLLQKQSLVRSLYLLGAVIVLVLTVCIIFIIYRNNVKSKANIRILQMLNNQVSEQKRELELKNKEKDRIMDVVVHDLRSPVGGIITLSDILLDTDVPVTDKDGYINIIRNASASALGLINELMEHSNDHKEDVPKEACDLVVLVTEVVRLLQVNADKKQQQIVFTHNALSSLTVTVQREKIKRVLANIISNAIKFSNESDVINVSLSASEQKALIKVSDSGIGIPAAHLSAVFDMSADVKRRGTAGEKSYGLGLSIAKQIIEDHTGRIWAESDEVSGSVFFVELPLGEWFIHAHHP